MKTTPPRNFTKRLARSLGVGLAALSGFAGAFGIAAASSAPPNCTDVYQTRKIESGVNPGTKCEAERELQGSAARVFPDGSSLPNAHDLIAIVKNDNSGGSSAVGPERAIADRLKEHYRTNPVRQQAVRNTVERLRTLFIERVEGGTARDQLSPEQRALIERLTSLEIAFDGEPCKDRGAREPSASYFAELNRLFVCPTLQNYPQEALIPVLAHELGHAVDPCFQETYELDEARLKSLARGNGDLIETCGLKPMDTINLVELALELLRNKMTSLSPRPEMARAFVLLYSCGLLKPEPRFRYVPDASPFRAISECTAKIPLSDPRIQSPAAKIEDWSQEEIDHLRRIFGDKTQWSVPKNSIGLSPRCASKRVEGFADHVGAEMTAAYLNRYPPQGTPPAPGDSTLLAVFTFVNCNSKNEPRHDYPSSNERLSAFLQYPEIQRHVGCQGLKEAPLCPSSHPATGQRAKGQGAVR